MFVVLEPLLDAGESSTARAQESSTTRRVPIAIHMRLNQSRPPLFALQLITISLISTRVRLSGGVAVRSFREPLSRLTWPWRGAVQVGD
jgi:hypothetical protein